MLTPYGVRAQISSMEKVDAIDFSRLSASDKFFFDATWLARHRGEHGLAATAALTSYLTLVPLRVGSQP